MEQRVERRFFPLKLVKTPLRSSKNLIADLKRPPLKRLRPRATPFVAVASLGDKEEKKKKNPKETPVMAAEAHHRF